MNDDFQLWTGELADRKCPDCGPGRRGRPCDRHRCRAVKKDGTRCKARVGALMEDHCATHGCPVLISFRPSPMTCGEPVVYVNTGQGWVTHACPKHAREKYPAGALTTPGFRYRNAAGDG